ncbi:glutathione S-transferase family protein [Chondromyces apiculatus]|uniref:Glutathione S-transferase n=1 Tax=Chondromyces apiculatus DSM 436 TaxID=1192034 RepID=A0A017T3K6_9BACT|nr:glutathione S-transferase family protein [Chondromyces apiculatus]EYF03425.1 glutathione S-transferase [Chondromyces apiculatus DSM 436]
MRLYTFVHSPNPLKVRLAMAEMQMEYEAVEVNVFRGEHQTEAFARVNPQRKVPVLQDGALTLRESNAILVYLGRTRDTPRWPNVATSEALAMQWLFFESGSMSSWCSTLWWNDVVAPRLGRPGMGEGVAEQAAREISRSLDLLDGHLADRQFLLGDALSLADCSVGVAAMMLRGTRVDEPGRWPHVSAYRDAIRRRASWDEAQGEGIIDLRAP